MSKYLDPQGVSYLWSKIQNISKDKLIYYSKTKEQWNINPQLLSKKDVLYIYTNYKKIKKQGEQDQIIIPGLKVGDGKSYLIDLPFINDVSNSDFENILLQHINNKTIHVTQEEKIFWNNKLNLFLQEENLVLNRN